MARDADERRAPTRREWIKYGGAVIGGGLLAGCIGGTSSGDSGDGANGTTGGKGASAVGGSGTENATTAGESGSYTVSMAPMGTVEFSTPPETYVTYKEAYAEFGVALGVGDRLIGIDRPSEGLAVLSDLYYGELPDFSLDTGSMTNIRADGENIDKELFYETNADLHLMDPNLPLMYFDWQEKDVEEISQQVAPFFGNFIRRERDSEWGSYEFYTLYQAFEKVAQVFQRQERYDAFATLHEEFLDEVRSRLPPESERPAIGLLNSGSEPGTGTFYAMDPTAKGYEMKHYRNLGVTNAFAGIETGQYGETDYETLLEVDPTQIYIHWGVTYSDQEFRNQFVRPMEEHPVGSQLTAVQENRVYKGGTAEQGPITNLFQIELLAQQQYGGKFPAEERLFDRRRVADIINGDI